MASERHTAWRGATFELAVGRVLGAALLFWMAWIHLHLWNGGYRHLPTVGDLFLANGIGATVVAVAVLVTPSRWLALPAAAGAMAALGTLAGLIISINAGLFGFKDSSNAPYAHLSIGIEVAAAVVLLALAGRAAALTGMRLPMADQDRPRRRARHPAGHAAG
jgi:hypothetical protein